jgi:hypothetical protein
MRRHDQASGGPRRFAGLERRLVLGRLVPVAARPLPRLLGLAYLDRHRAGPGLLLERCNSIHTCGMRFPIDVFFLDGEGTTLRVELQVGGGRFLRETDAAFVLEVPSLVRE